MNEILLISLAIIIFSINLIPYFIVLGSFFPSRTAKTIDNATRLPGRAFVTGMVNFIFFLVIALAFFSIAEKVDGFLKVLLLLPSLLVTIILSTALSFGLCSMSQLIGERIAPTQSTWKHTLWGALLLGLGGSVPLVGWFLLLPCAAWVGMGAFIISFFQKTTG